MKVKDLKAQLEAYTDETELIVAYWDKETVENYASGWGEKDRLVLSETQWSLVIEAYEDGEWHWQSSAAEDFVEIAQKVVGDE
jgi:hypothetical protein